MLAQVACKVDALGHLGIFFARLEHNVLVGQRGETLDCRRHASTGHPTLLSQASNRALLASHNPSHAQAMPRPCPGPHHRTSLGRKLRTTPAAISSTPSHQPADRFGVRSAKAKSSSQTSTMAERVRITPPRIKIKNLQSKLSQRYAAAIGQAARKGGLVSSLALSLLTRQSWPRAGKRRC